jgi:general stress protein 26
MKPPVSKKNLLSIAQGVLSKARCWTLITVDKNGNPRARTMSSFPPDEQMVVRLGANPRSRKIEQIKNNPNVIVYYLEPTGFSYVSLMGTASLVNDPNMKAKYWKEGWTRYYPDPKKDYILIEVKPKRMEICSFEYKLFWDESGKPAVIEF